MVEEININLESKATK